MKHKLLHLQSLVTVALCVIMAMAFTSCSDDDKPATDELSKSIVGTWAQDGDNDILVVNANGTGIGYENPSDYQNSREGYKFKWSYNDGWVHITIDYYGETQIEEMRAKTVSKDKIVWQRYAVPTEGYDPSEDDWDGHDAFGYYDLWTWERYTK